MPSETEIEAAVNAYFKHVEENYDLDPEIYSLSMKAALLAAERVREEGK